VAFNFCVDQFLPPKQKSRPSAASNANSARLPAANAQPPLSYNDSRSALARPWQP